MDKRVESRMCSRKTRFKDRMSAKRSVKTIRDGDGTRMRIYECDYCSGYHLTYNKEVKNVGKKRIRKDWRRGY